MKTLRSVIRESLCVGPLSGAEDRLQENIREFIGDKFTEYMINNDLSFNGHIKSLFEKIVEREFKEPAQTIQDWKKK